MTRRRKPRLQEQVDLSTLPPPISIDPYARCLTRAPYDLPEHRRALGPNLRPICRWCAAEVPPGRHTWCSDDCVEEFLIRKSPAHARRRVEARDRGVCSACGLDTRRYREVMYRLLRGAMVRSASFRAHWKRRRQRLRERLGEPSWEMDHVVAVHLGGGSCGLDNLRTLCQRCHSDVTRAQATDRARVRRVNIQASLFPEPLQPDVARRFDRGPIGPPMKG